MAADGWDQNRCGLPAPLTLTYAADYEEYYWAPDFLQATMSASCTFDTNLQTGVCEQSNGGPAANIPGKSTSTLSSKDFVYVPVTLTQDLDSFYSAELTANPTISLPSGLSFTLPAQTQPTPVSNPAVSTTSSDPPADPPASSSISTDPPADPPASSSISTDPPADPPSTSATTSSSTDPPPDPPASTASSTNTAVAVNTSPSAGGAIDLGTSGSLILGSFFALVAGLL